MCISLPITNLTHGDKELGSIGIRTGIGHRKQERLVVHLIKVLIFKLLAVDRLAASSL